MSRDWRVTQVPFKVPCSPFCTTPLFRSPFWWRAAADTLYGPHVYCGQDCTCLSCRYASPSSKCCCRNPDSVLHAVSEMRKNTRLLHHRECNKQRVVSSYTADKSSKKVAILSRHVPQYTTACHMNSIQLCLNMWKSSVCDRLPTFLMSKL